MNTPRYKRGDKHPSNAGLFFLRYGRGKEVWVSRSKLDERYVLNARSSDKRWKQTPKGREYMRVYFQSYMKRPEQKARQAAYYSRADVRTKIRARYHSDPSVKAKIRVYVRKISKTLNYRLAFNLRNRIRRALRRPSAIKSARTYELIGCSISALRVHLQSQFTEQMTWENYGQVWHIDHKLPLSRFDLTDPKQQRIAFHFENMQPLLAIENLRKNDKIEGELFSGRQLRKLIPFKAA